ncbi:MAG TPA: zinc-binding dehydrogenase [Aeromicrobium sp.]|nr:zinc-binding dehydrogenase [Aeromicrobium sp.]
MRAVTVHHGRLQVEQVADLTPGPGQILLDVTRCGICGSDLHARHHADVMADAVDEVGYPDMMRLDHKVVMGHEFTGTIADYGPRTHRRWDAGTPVVALPMLQTPEGAHLTGLSPKAPGGYAEQVLVSESMTFPVPPSVDPELAALTEPMAVALHAVNRGAVGRNDTALVIDCGPIGLAVILMLKATGVKHVIASDYSAARRDLARRVGADAVIDPAAESPWRSFEDSKKYLTRAPDVFNLAFRTMRSLRAVPFVPWNRVMETAQKVGAGPKGPVVFECVGVPGVLEHVLSSAPLMTRVVVVGVCMEPDTFRPVMAINKEIDLRFVFAYDPAEFFRTLGMIAAGRVDPRPLITATVGLEGVADAFDALADPEQHAKILIDPSSTNRL